MRRLQSIRLTNIRVDSRYLPPSFDALTNETLRARRQQTSAMTSYSSMFVTCPECGAQCSGSSIVCWLCKAPLSGSKAASTFVPNRDLSRAASRPSNASATAVEGGDAVALVVLFVAVIAVGAGLALESPGLVIPFTIVATP